MTTVGWCVGAAHACGATSSEARPKAATSRRRCPASPFEDGQFDLALVSHLLFLYSERLDFEFHRAAVEELLRVAKEVRNFPLLTLDRKLSPHREPIRTHAAGRGWRAEIAIVPCEFQRGGNRHAILLPS